MLPKFKPVRDQLTAYRLQHRLTWAGLAAEMAAAGIDIPARTLHLACTNTESTPHQTTQYKLVLFLNHLAARATRRTPATKPRRRTSVAGGRL